MQCYLDSFVKIVGNDRSVVSFCLFEIFLYVNNKCVLLALSNSMLLFLTELGNFINYRVEDIKISGYLVDLCSIRMELDMKCARTGEYFFYSGH